jgi:hypothetical protein
MNTNTDTLQDVRDELDSLHRMQTMSEHAQRDGRVTDIAAWRAAIRRRAEQIRRLEQRRRQLERGVGDAARRPARPWSPGKTARSQEPSDAR